MAYTALDGAPAGLIAIAHAIRPNAKQAMEQLGARGIEVAMLTGDNQGTANVVVRELGVKMVFAEVQPGQKAERAEVAIETADVVLVKSDLFDVIGTVRGKRCYAPQDAGR